MPKINQKHDGLNVLLSLRCVLKTNLNEEIKRNIKSVYSQEVWNLHLRFTRLLEKFAALKGDLAVEYCRISFIITNYRYVKLIQNAELKAVCNRLSTVISNSHIVTRHLVIFYNIPTELTRINTKDVFFQRRPSVSMTLLSGARVKFSTEQLMFITFTIKTFSH